MQVRILRSFVSEFSPRPLITNELLEVAEDIAKQWILEKKAQVWTLTANPTPPPPAVFVPSAPPKTRRERATRP